MSENVGNNVNIESVRNIWKYKKFPKRMKIFQNEKNNKKF